MGKVGDGRMVAVNGVELCVDTFGDAGDPALVLIAGAAGSMDWDPEFCERLAAGRRFIVRYDQGDTGPATTAAAGDARGTLEDVAADVTGLLDALGLRTAHLIGMSQGALVAQHLALDHPDRVEPPALVIHDTADRSTVAAALLRHTSGGWRAQEDRLVSRSLAEGDPLGWFDQLYAAGEAGEVDLGPWMREEAQPLLVKWSRNRERSGRGRAIVVGCGFGADAEYIAELGYDTVAFDVAESAVRMARQRSPDSRVGYVTADLLDLPAEWLAAFDLVVEVITVQALPEPPRSSAIANITRLVAPDGTLVVVASRRDETQPARELPPWPLVRAEVDAFAGDRLRPVLVEELTQPDGGLWWRAEFRRPA